MELIRDRNRITVAGGQSSTDATAVLPFKIDPVTGRLLTDTAAGSGTVTSVSVVSANGLAGTVATATTTPAITLSTTITGVLKGNGTAISAALAGTDYQSPITLTTTGTSGAATFAANTLNIPQYAGTTYSAGTGLTLTTTTFSVNTSQNIATLSNLTSNGLVTTSGGVGTLGVTVPGTGVLTALAVNVGSAGAFVTFNGALGTPSSGTLTNATGLPAASVVAGTFGTGSYTIDTRLTVPQVITTANAITASGNAATVPVTSRYNIVTNNSAATLTITLTTASAVNMQTVVVQILDFSAVAQTLTLVNTENSTVTPPATTNGSTTLPLTLGFMFNSATTKWRLIAVA
jgi:hypothetical protein